LRDALGEAGYTADAVGSARRLHRFLPPDQEPWVTHGGSDGWRLRSLVRLLALGQPLSLGEARRALAPAVPEDLGAAGLLALRGEEVLANHCLLVQDGLLLAGDWLDRGDRAIVHAFTNPSVTLAQMIPRVSARSMLDLGTGSGVLALRGAAQSDRVTGVDINPRALMFARFNAGLNGVGNAEFLEGSWFSPVAGRRFDLIVGNTPYVLSPDQEFTYRDSDIPATTLLERLCRDAAAHLEPGGLGILHASWPHASDASEDDWSAVPAAWVQGTGCDAVIVRRQALDALDHAVTWNTPPVRFLDPQALRETVARWVGYCGEIGAEQISFGSIVLRRRESGEPWLSVLDAPGAPGERASEQLAGVLRGQDRSRSTDDRALLATCFSLPAGVDVSQRFSRRAAGFVARPAMVSLDGGLGVRAAIDPDALDAVFACDGTRPLGEIVEALAARRGLALAPLADIVAGAARELLAHGLLV
jgi:methylase of polypeptide subunit release factors